MFANYLILAAIPAALAIPAGPSVTPAAGVVDCDAAYTGQANLNCLLTQDGWNGNAASYVATAMYADNAAAYDAWEDEYDNEEYSVMESSFWNQPAFSTKTNFVTDLVTFEIAHASFISQPTLRAAITSILGVGFSINNAAVAQPTGTTGTAGTTRVSSSSGGTTVLVSSGATTTIAPAATGVPAGASNSSTPSRAGAWSPMQTGGNVHIVAGVAAGLVGLAIGL